MRYVNHAMRAPRAALRFVGDTHTDEHTDLVVLACVVALPVAALVWSALAFVLASKRDTRFVHHAGPRAVFAFESGGGAAGGTGTV